MKEKLLVGLLIFISTLFLFTSYIPNLYEASVVGIMPQDRIMLWGEHVYTYDYNVYLSKMLQGAEGRWSVVDKYDNHPHDKGVFLQMLYLLSGKAGDLIHLAPPLMFHLLRTILSFLWILMIIYLNIFFLKKPKWFTIGVFLSLLAASFPIFYQFEGTTWIGSYMSWWTELDVLKRISYLPHYTLNYLIVALLSLLLYKVSEKRSKLESLKSKHFILMVGILFCSFFIHPAGSILFFISWFLFQFISFIWQPKQYLSHLPIVIIQTVILFVAALIPLFYIREVTATYPWKSLTDFDTYNRIGVNVKEYIMALGPIFFTGVIGLILVLIKKERRLLSLVTWVLAAFVGIYIFKKFPLQSELRFVQTANHIPLAILSVYFFKTVYGRFKNRLVLFVILVVLVLCAALGLAQSYFSVKAQNDFIEQRAIAGQPLVPYPPQVMYPLKDFSNAIGWLGENTKDEEIVLSQVTAGNYIPAYAGNFVYLGHNPETPLYGDRNNSVNAFFSGTMIEMDARAFLQRENISYVFYGPQEKEKTQSDITKYPFLKVRFDSPYVTIFQVVH